MLRVFTRAKERFIVHLRPEDVAAELRVEADDQLTDALEQLVKWGNLRADVDTSRVTTVEDFHRKRSLYQLTAEGHAAEQAISLTQEALARRGQLQSVALADIARQLQALLALALGGRSRPGQGSPAARYQWRNGSPHWPITHRCSCPRCDAPIDF